MKASLLYRIASILLLLFALGHTFGFRQINPAWGIDSLIGSMKSTHFDANGFNRTYWDFYEGFGLFVTGLLVLAAAICWELSGLSPAMLAALRVTRWGLAICLAYVVYLSWRYFFTIPLVFSIVILVCLTFAAWKAGRVRDPRL